MKLTSVSRNVFRLASLAAALSLGIAAAHAQQQVAPAQDDAGPDPALANMAPADAAAMQSATNQDPARQPAQQQLATPPPQQEAAPIVRSAPAPADAYNAPASNDDTDTQVAAGEQALDDASLSADQPPPALPDYDQPPAPADDYLWTPGYWGYADSGAGYYWVPGVWVVPPYYGALWTPCYWGFYGGRYRYHPGYWGLHVGFYGGINYGYGYIGTGYFGGYWRGNAFIYNRAVTNVGVRVSTTNIYNRTVVYDHQTFGPRPTLRTSYNGGRGGIAVAPRPAEFAAMHETHTAPLPGQLGLRSAAAQNPQAAFRFNQGHPVVAAQQQPLGLSHSIANSPADFHQRQPQSEIRPEIRPENSRQPLPQNRPQPQQPQRQQPPPRPQPQSRPAPAPRAASPAPHAESKH